MPTDAERLDFLSGWTKGDIVICPPGNHGGGDGMWLVTLEDESRRDSYGTWPVVEAEGPTLRDAIAVALANAK